MRLTVSGHRGESTRYEGDFRLGGWLAAGVSGRSNAHSGEEVILFGSRGFYIYANARPFEQPSCYNMTLYPGR